MPDPGFRDNAPLRKRAAARIYGVNATCTGTTPATLVSVAAGYKLRVYRVKLRAFVSTVLAGATVGDALRVADAAVTSPLAFFRIPGAVTATRAAQGGQVIAATDAITVDYGVCEEDWGDGGFLLAASGNDLVAGTGADITTGVITFQGSVLAVLEKQ